MAQSRPPNLKKENYKQKSVTTHVCRVVTLFCLYIVTMYNGIYRCRSPPFLTF